MTWDLFGAFKVACDHIYIYIYIFFFFFLFFFFFGGGGRVAKGFWDLESQVQTSQSPSYRSHPEEFASRGQGRMGHNGMLWDVRGPRRLSSWRSGSSRTFWSPVACPAMGRLRSTRTLSVGCPIPAEKSLRSLPSVLQQRHKCCRWQVESTSGDILPQHPGRCGLRSRVSDSSC